MKQTEKPGITPEELCVTLGKPADTPVRVSGGQIENFRYGWAVPIMSHCSTAHYFERSQFNTADAFCGVSGSVRWLYGQGNYPRCSNCIKVMSRRRKAGTL